MASAAASGRASRLRQRVLQVGYAGAAIAVVALTDLVAEGLLLAGSPAAQRSAAGLALAGRVVGGWGLGMAFRLQFTRAVVTDRTLRLLLGVPACLVAVWPLAVASLPGVLLARLPGWLAHGAASGVATFAAVLLGLVLSLGVTSTRGRR